MGCRILVSRKGEEVFYCSTTMWAFGPVMREGEAKQFLAWLKVDPRTLTDSEHERKYGEFLVWKGERK